MNLLLAILWSLVLVCDIVTYAMGGAANWIVVFCPLIVLVTDKWAKYFKER